MGRISNIGLLLLIGIAACKDEPKDRLEAVKSSQTTIDKVKLTGLDGNSIDMKQFKDKTVFISFWATWCKPCIEEMPTIEQAQGILENENVAFLMASSESMEETERFRNLHKYKLNYVYVENSEELNIQALPTTFIFNSTGELMFSEMGYRKWDEKENIELILKIAKSR